MRRLIWALPLWLAASLAFGQATTVEVVEFYHKGLDHYFISADPMEVRDLDTGGVSKGWVRTEQKFIGGSPASQLPGATGICRFYGKPERGLDSHFYAATAAECAEIREKYPDKWLFESDNVFKLYLPDHTGACPAATAPVYRAWNNRADVNHRYTTDRSVHLSMLAKGYIEEGSGGNGKPVVAMCALTASTPLAAGVAVPECTLAADSSYPKVGETVTLTATCTNSPTKYVWSDTQCATGASNSCTLTGTTGGYKNYTVKGSNAGGDGVAVGALVQWQAPPPVSVIPLPPTTATAPSCTIISNTLTPVIATDLVLTASCTGSPTAYSWAGFGCAGLTTRTCATSEAAVGPKTYTVVAANAVGNGSPTSMTASWVKVAPPVGVNCTLFANPVSPVIGTSLTLTATCVGNPTTFTWVNCSSSTSTCMPTPLTSKGSVEYILTASNSAPSTHTATIRVTWQEPPSAPPPTPTGCQIENYPTVPVDRLAGLYMKSPNVAIKFRTANYVSTKLGKATSFEHEGNPPNRQASISDKPCDFTFAPSTINLDGPSGSTLIWFTLGHTTSGRVRLEPNRDYYLNLRAVGWTPEAAFEKFAVAVGMPQR